MNAEDYKALMHTVLDERKYFDDKDKKKHTVIFKVLVYFSLAVFLLTWVLAVYSWLTDGSFPEELVKYTGILFGASFCGYCCKTACEYKADKECEAKIKNMKYKILK